LILKNSELNEKRPCSINGKSKIKGLKSKFKNLGGKMPRKILLLGILLIFSNVLFAQDNLKKYHNFDFAKKLVTKAELGKLKWETDEGNPVSELALLRGVVFGKRGRIFKEKSIQSYLEKQSWYKPSPNFKNSSLTKMERDNLDAIRMKEAEVHYSVEPGDLRYWIKKDIPEDKIYANTSADWSVLIAEFEAIHGKTFPDQEWLQKYFDERYWYKRNPNYSPMMLSATERKNLEKFIAKKNEDRKIEISFGDMDKFQNVLLKEEQLKGVSFNELRLMQNEFFARRGKRFTIAAYKQAFEWQDWYKPLKDQKKVKLNDTEEANVKLLQAYESKMREKITTEALPEEFFYGMYLEDLRILRNEIFAKRGRVFKDAKLQKYFEAQSWYKADPTFTDENAKNILSENEFKNISLIKAQEEVAFSKFVMVEG
jgi:hypothetical protein